MGFSYTLLLIVITCGVSFYAYENKAWFHRLAFIPYLIKRTRGEYFRFITYAFVHADLLHLMFNMMVLYWFGKVLEVYYRVEYGNAGLYYFALLYFGGALFSTLPAMLKHKDNAYYTVVGASGATSALVFSFIALQPTGTLQLLFLPIPLPAFVFGVIILIAEYFLSKRGGTNIAHDAHIYGSIYGFVFTFLIDPDNWFNFVTQIQQSLWH